MSIVRAMTQRLHYLYLPPLLTSLLYLACTADPQAQASDTHTLPPLSEPGPGIDGGALSDTTLFDLHVTPQDTMEDSDSKDVTPVASQVRTCRHRFEYQGVPGTESVAIPGNFNQWSENALMMEQGENQSFSLELDLSTFDPGSYGYKFLVNESEWILDPHNKMMRFDDGTVNSKLLVPDCEVPAFELVKREVEATLGEATIEVALRPGVGGSVDFGSVTVTHNFSPFLIGPDEDGVYRIAEKDLPKGKHTWRFEAYHAGKAIKPMAVSFWVEETPFEWLDSIMYFAFIDRFEDAQPGPEPATCEGVSPMSNWMGGDWKGVQKHIENGYFDAMGVNTLWINAAVNNPEDCVKGLSDHVYTAYHGYFPEDLFSVEERFGTLEDLRSMVASAHTRGIRVVMDLVVNHVFETAAEWVEHEKDNWFNTPMYLCGWEQPETCWFQSYMPDLNHRNDVVVEYMSDMALFWIQEADLDGFRVDAVKHIHPHFLHTLRAKIEERIEPGSDATFWLVGETFTGGWGGGTGTEENRIKKYIGPNQLHGQFDFPLYWTLLETLGRHEAGLEKLADVVSNSYAFYGQQALMSAFLGNHDVPRFLSHAAGDIADLWGNGAHEQAWQNPPPQPEAEAPYERLMQAFTLLAGLQHIPLVYYGDEIGLAGAGDPDNRRPMLFDTLIGPQKTLLAHVKSVFKARRDSKALRRGNLNVIHAQENSLAFVREFDDSEAIVIINRGENPFTLDLSGLTAGIFVGLDKSEHDVTNPLSVPSRSSDILRRKP
jgi:glycosidase